MRRPALIISLSEPVNFLKESFRDYERNLIIHYQNKTLFREGLNPMNYNCNPYMTKLIQEILNENGNPELFGQLSPSTRILISDGLDRKTAIAIALDMFNITIGVIAQFIPQIKFADLRTYFMDFAGDMDLVITPDPKHYNELI